MSNNINNDYSNPMFVVVPSPYPNGQAKNVWAATPEAAARRYVDLYGAELSAIKGITLYVFYGDDGEQFRATSETTTLTTWEVNPR